MFTKKTYLQTLVATVLLTACAKSQTSPYQLPPDHIGLIAGDSSKTWKLAARFNNKTRMNMAGCFLNYQQTFAIDKTVSDNLEEFRDCGKSLIGIWKIAKDKNQNYYIKITSERIPELMNIEEDYKLFKVLELTNDQLTLQFRHKQFSNKTTTITDILVPSTLNVEGRDFHW